MTTTSNENEEPKEVFTERFNQLIRVIDHNIPEFTKSLDSLSKNELKRAFLCVVEHPWKQSRKVVSQNEVNSIQLGKSIVESTAHALNEYRVANPEITKKLEAELQEEMSNE